MIQRIMNSPHHPHHEHHDVHQQRLSWFFSFCNQRSSSSSNSSSAGSTHSHGATSRATRTNRRKAANRNKFALQYQQQLLQQKRQSSNVFGLDLTEHTRRFSDDDAIPHIVKSCTRFIEEYGVIFGIYRLSGMRVNIHKLRQDFDKNPKISMIDHESISSDAHAVACVLKQYFRELPTPLLTFHMYEKFIELFKQSTIATTGEENIDDAINNNNRNDNNSNNNNNEDEDDNNVALGACEDAADTATSVRQKISSATDTIDPEKRETAEKKEGSGQRLDKERGDDQEKSKDQNEDDENDDDLVLDRGDSATTITTRLAKSPDATQLPATETKETQAKTVTHQPLMSKSSIGQYQVSSGQDQHMGTRTRARHHFTTSASDSQLISLSSVVTTAASDIKYHVKLDDLRKLLMQLPRAHYQTLKFLMRHLGCIASRNPVTGMDPKNVAIVWAPNLLKPRELELKPGSETIQLAGLQAVICEQLIKHHEFLFDEDDVCSSISRND